MTPRDSGEVICRACRDGDHDNCVIANYRYTQPGPRCACPCPVEPASGELRHVCADPDCDLCAAKRAIKPDSDEREVCGFVFDGLNSKRYSCNLEAGHVGPHVRVDPLGQRAAPEVTLPHPLAQRILAALEDPGLRQTYGFVTNALADELRAIVERKT